MPTIPSELAAVAAGQHGVFTFAQALEHGLSRGVLRRLVETRALLRVVQGVYAESGLFAELDADALLLARAHAEVLSRDEEWFASRRTAAVAHRLALLGDRPRRPQLVRRPDDYRTHGKNRFERLTTLLEHEVTVVDGLPTTTRERLAIDQAREESFLSGLTTADSALRHGADRETMLAIARRCAGWPGGTNGLRVARLADGLAANPLESISRGRWHLAGLPVPETQVKVYRGQELLGIADFLLRDHNLVGEADGKAKYLRDPGLVYAGKRRDERFQDVGLEVAHWSWDDALRVDGSLESKVRRGMARGLLNQLDSRVRFVPMTLEESLDLERRLAG